MKSNSTLLSLNSTKLNIETCKTLLDLNNDSITIFRISDDGNISNFIEANLATETLFEYTVTELLSLNITDLNLFSNIEHLKILQAEGKIFFTTSITTKLGTKRTVEIESFSINYDNQPSFLTITRDVTERKQLKKNVNKAYNNLTTILEAIPDLLFEVDIEGRIYYYQVPQNDLIPQSSFDFSDKLFSDIYPADAANVILEAIQETNINGWSTGKQYSLELPNGKKWFELSVSLIKDNSVKVNHFIVLTRDITKQKIAEEQLKFEKEQIKNILDLIGSPIFLKDNDRRIFYANNAYYKLNCLDPKSVIGKTLTINVPEKEQEHLLKIDRSVLDTGIPNIREEELTINGVKHTIITSKTRSIDALGNKILVGSIFDITDRKKAEEYLLESNRFAYATLDALSAHIAILDENANIIAINAAWRHYRESNQLPGHELKPIDKKNYLHVCETVKGNNSEEAKSMADGIRSVMNGELDEFTLEYSCHSPTEKKWFNARVTRFPGKGDLRIVVAHQDITERKLAEEKLISSEKFLNQTQIIANLGSFFLDFTTEKWTSTAVLDIVFGIDANFEKTVSSWVSIIHPKWKKEINDHLINDVIGKKINFNKEYKIIKINSKKERWVHGMGEIIFDKNGKPLHLIGSIQDITERKEADEKLKLASEKFQDLVNSTGGIVWEADPTTFNFNYVSQEAERLLGYPIKDWLTEGFWANHIHPDERDGTLKFCASQTKLMKDHDFTYRFRTKKGNYVWLRDIVTVVPENGKPKWLRGVMFDITDQKITNQLLQESEEKYRGLVENSPDAIIIFVDEKIVFINNMGLKMLDTTDKTKIIGKSLLQFVHPNSISSVTQRMNDVTKDNNASAIVEERFITAKGVPFDVELKAIPIIFGEKSGIQVIVHDITKRKQVAFELKKTNRVYALISQINNLILRTRNREELFQEICDIAVYFGKFKMSWIGIVANDNQTINASAFAGFEDGYFRKEFFSILKESSQGTGPSVNSIRTGKTIICNDLANDPMSSDWRKDALDCGYNSLISIPITVRNKIIGCYNLYSDETNYFTSIEEIILLEKIVLNISFALETILIEEDRKRTEVKIRQLSQAVEQSPVTIVITNTNGKIEYVNPKYTETTGYNLEEVIGHNSNIFKSGNASIDKYKDLRETIFQGKDWHGEFHNKKKDGTLYWESATVSPIVNDDGKTTHFIAIKEDITQRKNVEEELIKAKEKAEESDRLKLAFLANMSHEIRTPMNGILGFTELLKEPKLSGEEQKEYIGIIEKSGKRMLNIINDIINISKIESGQIEVSYSETNVNEQIDYLDTFFKLETKQKGIQLLATKKLLNEDCYVLTDREKLYAVLTNLVKNAIKFTNEGSIEFGCQKKGNTLEFFVKDTGLGIPKSQQNIVFERFRQVNETLTRSYEGSGLGLAISKAYIEMLDGKIWVESEEGTGSTFRFTIPYQTKFIQKEKKNTLKKESDSKKENKIKDLKVLIVEDDSISKLLITIAVKPFSKEIIKVSNGIEAVAVCEKNPDIDLVMMDINMPEMDGYEATKKIREFNKDLVIIAQTANGLQRDREAAIESGCTNYISKPINLNSLNKLIHKYFSNTKLLY